MDDVERSEERAGGTEDARREDGAGRREPLPQSEKARGNVEPDVEAPKGSEEIWTPEHGTETLSGDVSKSD